MVPDVTRRLSSVKGKIGAIPDDKIEIEMNEVEDGDGNEDIVENEETPAASGSGTGLTLQDRTLSSQGSSGANIVAKSSKLRRKEVQCCSQRARSSSQGCW